MAAQKRKFYAKLMQVVGQIDGQNLDAHRFSQAAYAEWTELKTPNNGALAHEWINESSGIEMGNVGNGAWGILNSFSSTCC